MANFMSAPPIYGFPTSNFNFGQFLFLFFINAAPIDRIELGKKEV